MRIGLRYAMNFVWATFMHRPFTDDWIDAIFAPLPADKEWTPLA